MRLAYRERRETSPPRDVPGPTFNVGKVLLGAIRDFEVAPNVRFGAGGLYAVNFVPERLEALYGGEPGGAMAFIRLRID